MKSTYTITGAIEKEIEDIAKRLCPMQNRLENGKLQVRKTSRVVNGSDFTKEQVEAFEKVNNVHVEANKLYVQKGTEPVLINHKINLCKEYSKKGREGIESYIKMINAIVEAFQQKKKDEQSDGSKASN